MKKPKARARKGAGSVTWREAEQRYVGSITLGRDRQGVQIRSTIVGPRGDQSDQARLGVVDRLALIKAKRPSASTRDSLAQYLDVWLREKAVSDATRVNYEWAIGHIVSGIGRIKLFALTRKTIRDFYASLDLGDAGKEKVRRVLHTALQDAVTEYEYISDNPATGIRVAREHPRPEIATWSPDDVLKFLRVARTESRYYPMYLLSLATTLGPGELFALQWENIDLERGFLSVVANLQDVAGNLKLKETKTQSRRRRIDLPAFVIAELKRHKGNAKSGFVFTSPEGMPIRRTTFRTREWLPLLKKADVPAITLYGLRHSANGLLGTLGIGLLAASRRMGHSSTRMTADVYGHVFADEQRSVANAIDSFLEKM